MRELSTTCFQEFINARFEKLRIRLGFLPPIYICDSASEFDNMAGEYTALWAVAMQVKNAVYLKPLHIWPGSTGSFKSIILHEMAHYYIYTHVHGAPAWVDEAFAMLVAQQYVHCKGFDENYSFDLEELDYHVNDYYAIIGSIVDCMVRGCGEMRTASILTSPHYFNSFHFSSISELRTVIHERV